MRVRLEALVAVLAVGSILVGCTTHRADLEPGAANEADAAEQAKTTMTAVLALLAHQVRAVDELDPDAVAPLVSAAAIVASTTGDSSASAFTRRYADALMRHRLRRAGIQGFAASAMSSAPEAEITAIAAIALLDAQEATGDSRYGVMAGECARAVANSRLGWTDGPGDVGVKVSYASRLPSDRGTKDPERLSIWATATAWQLLRRTGNFRDAGRARATVLGNQAAVGRWYAFVGTTLPMGLTEWATTLNATAADPSSDAQGILGAGVPAIYAAGFTPDGQVADTVIAEKSWRGLALSLGVLAQYADRSYAERAFPTIGRAIRADGSIGLADGDAVAEAYFTLAFARQLVALKSAGT